MMKATKKAIKILQKFYDEFGPYGCHVKFTENKSLFSFLFQVNDLGNLTKELIIGFFSELNGDELYDPVIELNATILDGKIESVDILTVRSNISILGYFEIENNKAYRNGIDTGEKVNMNKLLLDFLVQAEQRCFLMDIFKEIEKYVEDDVC